MKSNNINENRREKEKNETISHVHIDHPRMYCVNTYVNDNLVFDFIFFISTSLVRSLARSLFLCVYVSLCQNDFDAR